MSYHKSASFVTLTYKDDAIPKNNSVSKDELQRFFKRLRIDLRDRKICYFACGEYGEQYQRPHYHAIILGIHPKEDQKLVDEAWGLGFTYFGSVTYDSCRYTADYIMKSFIGKKAKDFYGDREPPFSLKSIGIGKRYALDNAERLKKNRYITIRGRKIGLPRYYGKVLHLDPEDYMDEVIMRSMEAQEDLEKRAKRPASAGARAVSERKQREATIKSRISLRRKGLM
nr:MAG: replication initiator protein [Microvirus sp.]